MFQTSAYFCFQKLGGVVSFVADVAITERYDLLAVYSSGDVIPI